MEVALKVEIRIKDGEDNAIEEIDFEIGGDPNEDEFRRDVRRAIHKLFTTWAFDCQAPVYLSSRPAP